VDVAAHAGGDTAAGLMWPSRDTAMTRTFLRHGLSTPFWHRWNYRPLWTSWQARPHSTLR
jgi:hypothetical protein